MTEPLGDAAPASTLPSPEPTHPRLETLLVDPVLGFVEELAVGVAAPPRTLAASPWPLARLPVAVALTGGRSGVEQVGRVALRLWEGFLDAFPAAGRVPSDPPPGFLGARVLRPGVGVDRRVLEAFWARAVVPRGPAAATAYCLALLRLTLAVDAILRELDPPAWPPEQPLGDLREILRERLGRVEPSGRWRARAPRDRRDFDEWDIPTVASVQRHGPRGVE